MAGQSAFMVQYQGQGRKMAKPDHHWMSHLKIRHPGIFSAAAKRAGMSTHAYAEKEKGASGKTGKRARLALAFEKARKK